MPRNTPCHPRPARALRATAAPLLGLALLAGCAQTAPVNPFAAMPDNATASPVINFRTCRKPDYPPAALAARVEGTVTLAFLVRGDGTARETVVRKSSGDASLDEAARAALARCRFQPGTVNGAPKEQWTELRYVWKADEPAAAASR